MHLMNCPKVKVKTESVSKIAIFVLNMMVKSGLEKNSLKSLHA